jgi:hypothetical protein
MFDNKNQKKELINICHLIGFRPKIDEEIHLDDEYKIRKLTQEEKEALKKAYENNILFTGWKSYGFCIETKDTKIKELNETQMEMQKVIQSMRLFSGHVISQGIIFPKSQRRAYIFSQLRCHHGNGDWVSSFEEISDFIDFWNSIKEIINPLDIWCRYFSKAVCDFGYIDALIDFTIVMETILVPEEKEKELRYRFGLRASLLLSDKFNDRKIIKDNFRYIYDNRSSAVHSGKTKNYKNKKNKQFNERKLLDYLNLSRKIICLYLENKRKWQEILKQIELGNKEQLKHDLANSLINVPEIKLWWS